MSGDFDFEPIRGLPANLPQGERLLWQGAPDWQVLARRGLHVRKIAAYFAILLTWSIASSIEDGRSISQTLTSTRWLDGFAALALIILFTLAYLIARTTVYSITSKRIILRFGLAVPMTVNLPFACIKSAALKQNVDGTGDIPLALTGDNRVAWLAMWPHIRPWQVLRTQPMLRCIPNAQDVALVLAKALKGEPMTLVHSPTISEGARRWSANGTMNTGETR